MPVLSVQNLSHATTQTVRPPEERPEPGLVHLGIGAFFRAQTALYIEEAMQLRGGDWGVIGVSLRSPTPRDQLAPQDFLYTALERDSGAQRARIIGAVRDILVAPENPLAVLEWMRKPAIKIITLTITEKGYCHDPATGSLNWEHPEILHDIENPQRPRSAIGFIVEALAQRKADRARGFTVISCDNLAKNGKLLSGLVQQFAARRDPALAQWIAQNATFPCSMVDRIVPATTESDLTDVAAITNLTDAAPVVHEPFRQWVIEDDFVEGTRPAWDLCGAQFVKNVAPYEDMKLRLLNASHSALAYLGYLSGRETISEAVSDPVLRAFVNKLWQGEIIPVMTPLPGIDLGDYTRKLLARFSNTAIRHRTWQIAMDGSQKLPPRILSTMRARLARQMPAPLLTLVTAAWIRYVRGVDDAGKAIDVSDPLAGEMQARLKAAKGPIEEVDAMLSMQAIFGDLSGHAGFRAALLESYDALSRQGAHAAAARLVQ
jgi:fructuronate reductase